MARTAFPSGLKTAPRYVWDPKDPDDEDDYAIDLADRLTDGETLAGRSFIVPAGITLSSDSIVGTKIVARLSGGTPGQEYAIEGEGTTSSGRVIRRTAYLTVVNL